jgi:AcrR family transcriptional regulator
MTVTEPSARVGGRHGEHASRTRELIIASAREALIGEGYAQFSLGVVATHAHVTRMTIYNQFGSRLGLLEAVADDLTMRAGAVVRNDSALAEAHASDALRALVRTACHLWSVDPLLFRRLFGLSAVDPQAQQVLQSRDQVRVQSFTSVLNRLHAEGRVRSQLTIDQATAMLTALTSFPALDQMASAMAVSHDRLIAPVMLLIEAIVDLEPPSPAALFARDVDAVSS